MIQIWNNLIKINEKLNLDKQKFQAIIQHKQQQLHGCQVQLKSTIEKLEEYQREVEYKVEQLKKKEEIIIKIKKVNMQLKERQDLLELYEQQLVQLNQINSQQQQIIFSFQNNQQHQQNKSDYYLLLVKQFLDDIIKKYWNLEENMMDEQYISFKLNPTITSQIVNDAWDSFIKILQFLNYKISDLIDEKSQVENQLKESSMKLETIIQVSKNQIQKLNAENELKLQLENQLAKENKIEQILNDQQTVIMELRSKLQECEKDQQTINEQINQQVKLLDLHQQIHQIEQQLETKNQQIFKIEEELIIRRKCLQKNLNEKQEQGGNQLEKEIETMLKNKLLLLNQYKTLKQKYIIMHVKKLQFLFRNPYQVLQISNKQKEGLQFIKQKFFDINCIRRRR